MDEQVKDQDLNTNQKEAIQELIQEILEKQGIELDYESFEGYEVPPRSQFAMTKKPQVSIKKGSMTFNKACLNLFKGIVHVVPIINGKDKKLAIIPCAEEEYSSVEWARKKDDKWLTKNITARELLEKIFTLMDWEENSRYKIVGQVKNSERGLILVFELKEAVRWETVDLGVNPDTGRRKTRQQKYYPKEYDDKFGKEYSEYAAARQQEGEEQLANYSEIPAVVVSEISPESLPAGLVETAREINEQSERRDEECREA